MVFILALFFIASRFYVNTVFSLVQPGFAQWTFNQRISFINDPQNLLVFLLWQAPGTVLLFAWLVLFAYVTYNIQRPKTLQHVLAVAVAFVFVILVQTAFYYFFFYVTGLTPGAFSP